jgi:hypothetical protein
MIKVGSKWSGGDGKIFVVLGSAKIEENDWVYYRKENSNPPQEFSCFEESFLARFQPLPD